jgi:glycosyltransferase involved in cell wall biosynthesis
MTSTTASTPFRVAICSGVYVDSDGISGTIACKLALFERLRRNGAPVEAVVFCHGTNRPGPLVTARANVADLLLHPGFLSADLYCFEFGVQNDLFDAIFVLPARAAKLGVYHNVTPLELVSEAQRPVVCRSLAQRYNLFEAHHVVCVSEFNRRDLLQIEFPPERISVVPAPTPAEHLARLPTKLDRRKPGPVEFLFVGRFVRAKGVVELLDAADQIAAESGPEFRLSMIFNRSFSDQQLLAWLDERLQHGPDRPWLRLLPDATDAQLMAQYAAADCFVIPSHHEGFCTPVVEALSAGCHVIAADAGNLPFILDGLGKLFPVRDVDGLAGAMRGVLRELHDARAAGRMPVLDTDRGRVPVEAWAKAVDAHLRGFSQEVFEAGFAHALRASLTAAGREIPDWMLPGNFEALAGIDPAAAA